MANINVAFGFKPVGKHGSSPATQGTSQYFIASDASAIFQSSPVKAELTGGTIQIGSATGGDQLLVSFDVNMWMQPLVKFSNGRLRIANTNFDIKGLCMTIHHRDLSLLMELTLTEQLQKQISSRL